MQIEYRNKCLEKVCTDAVVAKRKHGIEMAEKIDQRIGEIKAADSVEQMIQFGVGRCHPLKGNRLGQYAVDLVHPQRLIFAKREEDIQIVKIMEIEDYH